jgi:RNA polymerase sigma-32 factor
MDANDKSLAILIREADSFPTLTVERERELTRNWRHTGEPAAIRELVGSHLRLVIKIARGFAGYGLPLADLFAEGNLGLMQAATRFDPNRGFRFSTYAIWWIRAAMQEYVLHSWSLVKMGTTGAQKKLFFNLRRLKARLHELDHATLSENALSMIAKDLDVTADNVREMNCRLSGRDSSLNAGREHGADGEWLEFLTDQRPSQEEIVGELEEARVRRGLMKRAVASLNARERVILAERRLKEAPPTLGELSHRFALSNEGVRQIELRAVEKLRIAVLAAKNNGGFAVPATVLRRPDRDRLAAS